MKTRRSFLFLCALFMVGTALWAQTGSRDRILRRIEGTSSIAVRGNVHPFAQAEHDRGRIGASFRLEQVTMMFKPTDAQQADLDKLITEQHDPSSANYRHWLTPDEFADRFGLSANDVSKVVAWLEGQGFTVKSVARNRRSVSFSGQARQIESAFATSIHQYEIDGETYYANATDPVVPASLANVVLGFRALNNFKLKPRVRVHSAAASVDPQFTSNVTGNHYVAPSDFATIYDVATAYANGLNGKGQSIAVAGQTNILLADIEAFRAASGLPANDPDVVLVPGSPDPGLNTDDLGEADLDLEWAGAVAPLAHLIYVNSDDVIGSFQYAIEQNLAPILSMSYGSCEKNFSTQEANSLASLAQQANAQGMTIVAPTGDSGAADCDYGTRVTSASHGLSVDLPASLPYVTAMGGSEFNEGSTLWSTANSASNGSALSYLPEAVWNDTTSVGTLSAGGGGRSTNFSKPSWQVGNGVPNDGVRDVPDISLHASPNHDGYLVCSNGSCTNGFRSSNGSLFVVGGTSVSAPAFAGVVALLNQKAGSAQGNVNPTLYSLAASAPQVFHDITSGGNQVPCRPLSVDCTGNTIGYSASPGYDMASGIGSVDVANLIAAWPASGSNTGGGNTPPPAPTTQPPTSVTAPLPITDVEQGGIRTGYAIITPDTNSLIPTPTVSYGMVSIGIVQSQAGGIPAGLMTDGSLFADVIPGIGRNLGVALVNPSTSTANVTLSLKDKDGNAAGSAVTLSLGPQQQVAKFANELFSSAIIGNSFLGSLRVQSSTPVSVLGLRFSGLEFSTLPVIASGTAGSSNSAVIPQFAMGGGWATQIALVNNGTSTLSGRIDLFDASGRPLTLRLNNALQSTFTYSIPAGGVFVLAPRDVNGQSPF